MEESEKNKKLFLIICIFLGIMIFVDLLIKYEINTTNNFIVTKYTLKKRYPKRISYYFTYYFHGEKITTGKTGLYYFFPMSKEEKTQIKNLKIDGFYLARFNPKYPKRIKVDPSKQITDTIAILNAGFTQNDIIKMPK